MAKAIPLPGYETTYITRSDLSDDGLKTLNERVKAIIANYGGEIVMNEDWGKKKMAYPIEKESRGHYTYVVYTGKGEVVHEIERNLRIHDNIMRFLTVNLEKEFDAGKFTKRREEMKEAAKKRDAEREARREERFAERRGGDDRGERRSAAPVISDDASEGIDE